MHQHKWFMYNTKNSFEPALEDEILNAVNDEILYRMVEYAYLVCNCGEVKKTKAKLEE